MARTKQSELDKKRRLQREAAAKKWMRQIDLEKLNHPEKSRDFIIRELLAKKEQEKRQQAAIKEANSIFETVKAAAAHKQQQKEPAL